jgi:hypothetical protein
MASGRSYLCHSKCCAALIASAITRSECMRHKTQLELWRATPYLAVQKIILMACPKINRKDISKPRCSTTHSPRSLGRSARKVAAIYRRRVSIRWFACMPRWGRTKDKIGFYGARLRSVARGVDELVRDAKRPLEELTTQQKENIALLVSSTGFSQSGSSVGHTIVRPPGGGSPAPPSGSRGGRR